MTNSHHPLAWAQMARNARDYQISTAVAEIAFGATGDDLKRRNYEPGIVEAALERCGISQPEEQQMKIGDRVRVKKSAAEYFIQPWRGRFQKGREGTVVQEPSDNVRGWMVEWDHGKVKWPNEWRLIHRYDDLIVMPDAAQERFVREQPEEK